MPDTIAVEEYKRLVGLISDIEKQMVQIASGAVVVSVTILSAVFGLLLSNAPSHPVSLGAVYVALAPWFVFIPAFLIIVAHRNELCRAASYLRFFYEKGMKRQGWDGRVSAFRLQLARQEAHDPIPYIFWAIATPTLCIFYKGLWDANADCVHYLVPVIPVNFLCHLHWKYKHLLSTDYKSYLAIWERVAQG